MPFPETPRVIYDVNPIDRVICQLKFHPVLKIAASEPADFQEKVRGRFPVYREVDKSEVVTPNDVPPAMRNIFKATLKTGSIPKEYRFETEDEKWQLTLTRDFIALTAFDYERWEDFREYLTIACEALKQTYNPGPYTRVGLRYINVIEKNDLSIPISTPWSELLNPALVGVLSTPIADNVIGVSSMIKVNLNDNLGYVGIRHGLLDLQDETGNPIVNNQGNREHAYYLDNDFFTEEKRDGDEGFELLNRFNRKSGNLFRWCIQERLHAAMGPRHI